MARNKVLTSEAEKYIISQIRDIGEISTDEVMDLIRPHFIFDPQIAKEQIIRRKAHAIMAKIKDENGTRTCFAIKNKEKESIYINIETTADLSYLREVKEQLRSTIKGLGRSYKKTCSRIITLEGQMSLFDDNNDIAEAV